MRAKDILQIVSKYCVEIKYHNKHYVCHLPNGKIVVIASTSSDKNSHRQVYRDFRRHGVILKEFNY